MEFNVQFGKLGKR